MPHVAFVPLTGLRVRATEMLELGMTLPGLSKRSDALSALPALGVLTLAGMTPEPWTTSYHKADQPDEHLIAEIVSSKPTFVALSALTASAEEAYRLSRRLREQKIPVVLGGLHASVCSEEASRHCDVVVVGEGEPVWNAILSDALAGELKPTYKAAAAFDLKDSPIPDFGLLKDQSPPRFTLQTERGCPFACSFCGASRLLGPFRTKPVEQIRKELAEIGGQSRRAWVELADDNTFANRHDWSSLLETLGQANIRYFTESDWRVGENHGLVSGLAASGCVQLLVGIESLVFRYPGMGAKYAELSRIMDAVRAIQESGVVVNGCFVVGADGETNASIDRLAQFIAESPLAEVQVTLQTPFPGTALYRQLNRQGRLLHADSWENYTLFDVTYQPDKLTAKELASGFRRLMANVFSSDNAARRAEHRRQIWRNNPCF